MVTFPYNTNDFAFTLDDVFLSFSTAETNSYFDLTVTINYFEFFSSVEKTEVLEYKIPLFNQQQSYNVGRKIHRYLASLPTYNASSGFQYKVAKVSFLAKEIDSSDNSTINTQLLNDVKFIAGPKPKLLSNNLGFLSLHTDLEKVTVESIFNLSFLFPVGSHVVEIYKNNILLSSETITATIEDAVYLKKIDVATLNVVVGDLITVKIKNTSIAKEFVVSKKDIHFNQIVFIDAFKLPKTISFSGEYFYTNDYNQITHKYKRNLVEVLEIVTTEKVKSITLNTGNLLKSERAIIDELLDSKRAFLISNESVVLEMVPIAKKLEVENSADENQSYNVEFRINKSNA